MAVNVNGNIRLTASITDARSAVAGATNELGSRIIPFDAGWLIGPGTAAGLADKVWSSTDTVLTTATNTIDLAGVLTDAFGAVITFAKVRAFLVFAASANTTTIQVARPAANGSPFFAAASDALAPISAGGFACWCDPQAGFAVAGGTDLVSIINSAGATATYTVVVVGTSV